MTTKEAIRNINNIKNYDNEKWDMSIFNPKCGICGSGDVSVLYYHAYTHIPSVYICNRCGQRHENL